MSLDGVLVALLAENARCVPPLTPAEIEKIVEGKKDIHPDPVLVFPTQPPTGGNGTGRWSHALPAWPPGTPWETMQATTVSVHTWHIKGLIRHGMTFIGGAPKAAKSYIAYDIGLATVEQGLALGYWGCTPGACCTVRWKMIKPIRKTGCLNCARRFLRPWHIRSSSSIWMKCRRLVVGSRLYPAYG